MTNEDRAFELSNISRYGFSAKESNAAYNAALAMAKWKDEQLPKWHRIVEGDFPKITDDYLTVCQHKNKEDGILLYEIAYYTGEGWENRTHWEDIIAWREIPTF